MNENHLKRLYIQFNQAVRDRQKELTVNLGKQLLQNIPKDTQDRSIKNWRLDILDKIVEALGFLHQQKESWQFWEQYAQEAQDIVPYSVFVLERKALLYYHEGQATKAYEIMQEALHLASQLNNKQGLARTFQRIAYLSSHLGRLEEAVSNYQRALVFHRELNDIPLQLQAWNNIGIAELVIGRYDKSIVAFQEALQIATHLKEISLGMVLNNLGESYQDLFDMEQAYTYHRKALDFFESLPATISPNLAVVADTHRNLGVTLYYLEKTKKAEEHLQKALMILEEYDDVNTRLQVLATLVLIELKLNRLVHAYNYANHMYELAQKNEAGPLIAKALYVQGLCFQATGDFQKAKEFWQKCLFLAHETGQRMLMWRIHGSLASVSESPNLAQVHKQIASEIIYQIIAPIENIELRQHFLKAPEVKALIN